MFYAHVPTRSMKPQGGFLRLRKGHKNILRNAARLYMKVYFAKCDAFNIFIILNPSCFVVKGEGLIHVPSNWKLYIDFSQSIAKKGLEILVV